MHMKTIRMEEMNWPDIKAAMERGFTTVVVGVGSTEQHGPHLPTMTDERIGDALANRVALKLGGALQARTIAVGVSGHHLAFGGTLSLQAETLEMIIRDYVDSLVRSDRLEPGYLGPCGEEEVKIILERGMPALTPNGVLGDPRRASAANGEHYLERLSDFLSGKILGG